MAYLKINDIDFSMYVNELSVKKQFKYNAKTNASGNTVVDLINSKRIVEVGIIPLDEKAMSKLLNAINSFSVVLAFRNPQTNALENIKCIIPESNIDYYTIQAAKVSYNAFKLKFIEL